MPPELGIIEGFYGKPWSWVDRGSNVSYLGSRGYGFYLYAPKADPYLRRRWTEDHPPEMAEGLADLAAQCRRAGVRFGIGLSPYEIYSGFGETARDALGRKLAFFDSLGVDDLAILFDDMRGDTPDLADGQVEVIRWVADRTGADRILMCPTYYADDPVLDRVFGERPPAYLDRLGRSLDPSIEIFWTGEEVCSRALSTGHLTRVAEEIHRKPFLWDNYPVNDGHRMSEYLHLRAFTGRPASIAEYVEGHGINPALQPTLTRIPALTLVDSYNRGELYQYGEAFRAAAVEVLGESLGERVREDLLTLQDVGLDRLADKAETLRERYANIDHPGAREIIGWLDGDYRITDEIVQTQ